MAFSTPVQISLDRSEKELPRLATGLVIGLGAVKLRLHLFTSVRHYR